MDTCVNYIMAKSSHCVFLVALWLCTLQICHCLVCFPTQYPLLLGGTNGDTYFTTAAMHATLDEFVIGGKSSDTSLVTSIMAPNAILMYVKTGGQFAWTRQLNGDRYDTVKQVAFSPLGQVVATLHPFGIIIVDPISGNVLFNYEDQDLTQGMIQSDAFAFDSNNILYLAMQSGNFKWQVIAFDLNTPAALTPYYYLRSTTYPSAALSIALGVTSGNVFVGGVLKKPSPDTNQYASVTKLIASSVGWSYGFGQDYSAKYLVVSKLAYIHTGSTAILYAALTQNLIDVTLNQVLMRVGRMDVTSDTQPSNIREVNIPQLSATNPTTSNVYVCVQLQALSNTMVGVFIDSPNVKEQYYAQITFGSTPSIRYYTFSLFKTGATQFLGAASKGGVVYYFGSSTEITAAPTLTNGKQFGFIMTLDQQSSCYSTVAVPTLSAAQNLIYFGSSYVPLSTEPITPQGNSLVSLSVQNYGMYSSGSVPRNSGCPFTPSVIIIDSLLPQTYQIYLGSQSYTMSDFTIDISGCSDAVFTYTVNRPQFVTFVSATTTFTFNSNSATDMGTHTISVKGTLPSGQSHTASFLLTVSSPCGSATLSTAVMTDITYVMTMDMKIRIATPMITCSIPQCLISSSLFHQISGNWVASTASFITYIEPTQTVKVYTTDPTMAGTHFFKIKAWIQSEPSVVSEALFSVTILTQCEGTPIYPSLLPDYFLAPLTTSELITFDFQKALASCTSPISYIFTSNATAFDVVLNPIMNSITFQSMSAPSSQQAYDVTVTGQIAGTTNQQSFTFVLYVRPQESCTDANITATPIGDHSYFISNTDTLSVPFQQWSQPTASSACPVITYSATYSPSQAELGILVQSLDPINRVFTFQNGDIRNDGLVLTVTLQGMSGTQMKAVQFSVIFLSPCKAPFTVFSLLNPGLDTEVEGFQDYYITDPTKQIIFPQYQSTASSDICGTVRYEVTRESDLPLNGAVYTYTEAFRTLEVQTNNEAYTGVNYLKLVLSNSLSPTYQFPVSFIMRLKRSCAHNIIIPPADVTQKVKIGVVNYISLNGFSTNVQTDSVNWCPDQISYTCVPEVGTPAEACSTLIYQIQSGYKRVKVQTNDLQLLGKVHRMRIYGGIPPSVTDTVGMLLTVKFTSDICQNAYLVKYPIDTFAYDVSYNIRRIVTNLNWDKSDLQCPEITYEIKDYDTPSNALDQSVFSYSQLGGDLTIFTTSGSKARLYRLFAVGTMGNFRETLDFNVSISNVCPTAHLSTPAIPALTYEISDPPLLTQIPPWVISYSYCGDFVYTLAKRDGSTQLEPFIEFDLTLMTLRVSTAFPDNAGSYQYLLIGTLPSRQYKLPISLVITYKCISAAVIPTSIGDQTYNIGNPNPLLITIPTWSESVGTCGTIVYAVTVNGKSPPGWLKFSGTTIQVLTKLSRLAGAYEILVTGTLEINKATSSSTFQLDLLDIDTEMQKEVDSFIEKASTFSFNSTQNSKEGKVIRPILQASITDIDFNQRVTIQFQKSMLVPERLEVLTRTNSLQFTVIKMPNGEQLNIVDSWQVISYSEDTLVVQLNISHPELLSQNKVYDKVKVIFKQNVFYQSEDQTELIARNYFLTRSIPPQLDNSTSTLMLQSVTLLAASSMTGTVSMNMILAMILGVSLKKVWMLMNTLQILTNIPLLSVALPSNALFTLQGLAELAKLNIIPKAQFKKYLKELKLSSSNGEKSQSKSNFQAMGFESTNILENVGLVFFLIVGIMLIAVFLLLIKFLVKRFAWLQKKYESLHRKMFFNSFLRSIQKGYLNFSIATLLALSNFSDDPKQQAVSVCLGMLLLSMPIFATVFFQRYFGRFEEEEFVNRYGSLYLNLKADQKWALMHTVIYFIRRLIYAFSIVFLDEQPWLQYLLFCTSSSLLLAFQLRVRPMDDSSSQAIEVFNESTILLIGCTLGPYSSEYFDEESQEQNKTLGWLISGLVLFNVFVNQVTMAVAVIQKLKGKIWKYLGKCRKWWLNRNQAKKGPLEATGEVNQNLSSQTALQLDASPTRNLIMEPAAPHHQKKPTGVTDVSSCPLILEDMQPHRLEADERSPAKDSSWSHHDIPEEHVRVPRGDYPIFLLHKMGSEAFQKRQGPVLNFETVFLGMNEEYSQTKELEPPSRVFRKESIEDQEDITYQYILNVYLHYPASNY